MTDQPPWQLPKTTGFGTFRVPFRNGRDKMALRRHDVADRLARHRLREENDEIHRVSGPECDADLGILLEPADARAMTGTRVDDHVGTEGFVGSHPLGRCDANESVVDRPLQGAAVHNHLVLVDKHGWLSRALVLEVLVAALAHRVPEQDRTLGCVGHVRRPSSDSVPGRSRSAGHRHRRGTLEKPRVKRAWASKSRLVKTWPIRPVRRPRSAVVWMAVLMEKPHVGAARRPLTRPGYPQAAEAL